MDLSKSQLENHYASVFGRPLPRVILVLLEQESSVLLYDEGETGEMDWGEDGE